MQPDTRRTMACCPADVIANLLNSEYSDNENDLPLDPILRGPALHAAGPLQSLQINQPAAPVWAVAMQCTPRNNPVRYPLRSVLNMLIEKTARS